MAGTRAAPPMSRGGPLDARAHHLQPRFEVRPVFVVCTVVLLHELRYTLGLWPETSQDVRDLFVHAQVRFPAHNLPDLAERIRRVNREMARVDHSRLIRLDTQRSVISCAVMFRLDRAK
ncbi:hypothetical protein A6A28_16425 [Streptomyces sp. CB03578]|nr:hypothetical protein A6A28_16425 [Streptomyces sp. CB03578]